jgi:hypothetical protein
MFTAIRQARGAVALAATLLAVTVVPSALARASAGPATFADPTGDAGTAPDVTTVVVSSDESKLITFQVNFAAPLAGPASVGVFVDSDRNSATGSQDLAGADYVLVYRAATGSVGLGQWNGTTFVAAPSATSLRVQSTASQVTFSINASELGNTSDLEFWVGTASGDDSAENDEAPNAGAWPYTVETDSGASIQLVARVMVAPKTTKAGRPYLVSMSIERADSRDFGGATGQVRCVATLGGRAIPARAHLWVGGRRDTVAVATCGWNVPKGAKGKTLRGTVTGMFGGATVTRGFSARVT